MNSTLPSSVSPIDLEKLCALASLDISYLSPEARNQLSDELHRMIALAQKVQNIPIADLKPLYHPCELSQPLREDNAEDTPTHLFRDSLLKNAPRHDKTNYLVPKVID